VLAFPLTELLDEQACYDWLSRTLHPDGLRCPQGHEIRAGQAPHDRHRKPIVDWRCRECGAVFNVFTGTVFSKSRYPCSVLVQILRGIGQGVPTAHLARELGVDRGNVLAKRHAIQELLARRSPPLSPSRRRGGDRRDVPERRREGDPAPGSRGPAAPLLPITARQQGSRARHLGERPPSCVRGSWS